MSFFDYASLINKLICCDLTDLFEDHAEFVGRTFQGKDKSTLTPDFEGETPGDILGVNFYDPELTREKLRAAAKKVFVMAHPDRFKVSSSFAKSYRIVTLEDANAAFNKYRLAYEKFCSAKKWVC